MKTEIIEIKYFQDMLDKFTTFDISDLELLYYFITTDTKYDISKMKFQLLSENVMLINYDPLIKTYCVFNTSDLPKIQIVDPKDQSDLDVKFEAYLRKIKIQKLNKKKDIKPIYHSLYTITFFKNLNNDTIKVSVWININGYQYTVEVRPFKQKTFQIYSYYKCVITNSQLLEAFNNHYLNIKPTQSDVYLHR